MRLFNVVMTEKEFNSYWRFLNDEIEKREENTITFAETMGVDPWQMFVGIFGLPESFFKTLEAGAKVTNQLYSGCAEFRFIQAVLKG